MYGYAERDVTGTNVGVAYIARGRCVVLSQNDSSTHTRTHTCAAIHSMNSNDFIILFYMIEYYARNGKQNRNFLFDRIWSCKYHILSLKLLLAFECPRFPMSMWKKEKKEEHTCRRLSTTLFPLGVCECVLVHRAI